MTEQWRDIPGYEGLYQVSDHGRVRSMRQDPPLILKFGRASNKGYLCVCLSNAPKPQKVITVHRLVAKAFLTPDDTHLQVNHKDGNIDNNHVSNLEWCTPYENAQHARVVLGALGRVRAITPDMAEEIAVLRRNKVPAKTIAAELGVSSETVINYMREYAPDVRYISKLSDADVPEIQAMRERGMTLRAIGEHFGVTDSMICRVLKGNRRNPANRKEQAS